MRGTWLGVVPYDFEPLSLQKLRDRMWNSTSDRIVVPQVFGVGWTLNLAALKRRYPAMFWLLIGFVGLRVLRGLQALRS